MENNLENKSKFFSQYLWQTVLSDPHNPFVQSLYLVPSDIDHRQNLKFSDLSLLLRPLSDITDEEAQNIPRGGEFFNGDHFRRVMDAYSPFFYEKFIGSNVAVYQYLQSQGFALPYLDLSVEDLISYGWLKLTEHTK
jgi:hypothetical protein